MLATVQGEHAVQRTYMEHAYAFKRVAALAGTATLATGARRRVHLGIQAGCKAAFTSHARRLRFYLNAPLVLQQTWLLIDNWTVSPARSYAHLK